MDGGVGENNPAFLAATEALQMDKARRQGKQDISLLISVGTGQPSVQSRFGTGLIPLWKLLKHMRKTITATKPAHTATNKLLQSMGAPYFRFDVPSPGLSKMKLDECKVKKRKEVPKPNTAIPNGGTVPSEMDPTATAHAPTTSTESGPLPKRDPIEPRDCSVSPNEFAGELSTANPLAGMPPTASQMPPTASSSLQIPPQQGTSTDFLPAEAQTVERTVNLKPQDCTARSTSARSSPTRSTEANTQDAYYNPEKFQYKTFDKIKLETDRYCNRGPSMAGEDIQKQLTEAARVLVYYRIHRERDAERWQKFTSNPSQSF